MIGLEAELRQKNKVIVERERQLVDAEVKEKEEHPISDEDASRYSSILIECCYRHLNEIYLKG